MPVTWLNFIKFFLQFICLSSYIFLIILNDIKKDYNKVVETHGLKNKVYKIAADQIKNVKAVFVEVAQ